MISQYYDKMMEALAFERDKHISQIVSLAESNISSLANSNNRNYPSKPSKNDMKLRNFGIELGKVLDGVEETGIHIKELWKINQDYNDVVKQKVNETSSKGYQNDGSNLQSFEFKIADEHMLKDLAQRVGQVITKQVGYDYFMNEEHEYDPRKSPKKYYDGYQGYSFHDKIEYVPTFGVGYNDESKRYSNHNGSSTEKPQEIPSRYDHYRYQKYENLKEVDAEEPESKINPSYHYTKKASYGVTSSIDRSRGTPESKDNRKYQNYTPTYPEVQNDNAKVQSHIYNSYHRTSQTKNYNNAPEENIDQFQRRNSIEEIKKKYSKDKYSPRQEDKTVVDMYNQYKDKLFDKRNEKEIALEDNNDKNEKIASYYKDIKGKQQQQQESAENEERVLAQDEPTKKVFKKLKTKVKGEKENVLKTIKLKLK